MHRLDGPVYEILCELLESCSCYVHIQMERTGCVCSDERQIDLCGLCCRELLLCFLCSLFESLKSHLVLSEVDAVLFLEAVCKEVHQGVVEIISAEVCIAVCSEYFKYSVAELEYGYIECAAAQVVYKDLVASCIFIESVCQRSSCRLVDDSLDIEACDLARVFCRLLLCIAEVSRNCDYSFCYLLAEICFSVGFQFLKYHCRDILRCIVFSAEIYRVVFTHMSLDG